MTTSLGRFGLAAGALALAWLAALPAGAQDGHVPAPVIVVVDYIQVTSRSSAMSAITAERDKYAQTYQSEIKKEEEQLRAAEQDLTKQRSEMPAEAFAEKWRGFQQRVAEFQRRVQGRLRGLDVSYQQALQKVQNKLDEICIQLAQENGANIVLPRSQLVLFDPKMDISEQAATRLNQQLPSVAFPTPHDEGATPPFQPNPAATK